MSVSTANQDPMQKSGITSQFLRQPPVFFILFVREPGKLRAAAADRLLVGCRDSGRPGDRVSIVCASA
jgi:hypothetical protein